MSPLAGTILVWGIASEVDQGHFISWLTLPMVATFSLALYRNIWRALVTTFSMAFLHDGVWYFLGNLEFNVPLSNLFSKPQIFSTFFLLPVCFTFLYVYVYHPPRFWRAVTFGFLPVMAIWDVFGFPITTLPKAIPFQSYAWLFEITSWLAILCCYLFVESQGALKR